MPSNNPPERPKKLQRISQACDLCHRRSIRCRPSSENPHHQCQNCYDFAVDCTYNRPSRRRRNQSGANVTPPNILPMHHRKREPGASTSPPIKTEDNSFAFQNGLRQNGSTGPDYTRAYVTVREGREEDLLGVAWRSFAAASQRTIERYLEIYMDIVYPMFPVFHGPSLWRRLHKQDHHTDRGFFASIMAACALAAARTRDGALGIEYDFDDSAEKSSEVFFSAAQDAIPKDLSKATGLGFLRACGLLALTSMQYGQLHTMHIHMGHYHTLSTLQAFHDEEKWPVGLTVEEKEESRRLFWTMYSWDVYTAIVFGTFIKTQETHSNVSYPSEVNDDELTSDAGSPVDETNWLRGWNFTTDLYRTLEHTIKRVRRKGQQREDRVSIVRILISEDISDLQVMENILNLYYQLPSRFKEYKVPITGDRSQDIYGFQAANIQATLQLVRITLFESNPWTDVHQKCDVAEEVLSTFLNIDRQFLRAISTPLVYQLGGIGQVLASGMQGTLTEDLYQRIRSLVNSMADLLESLESGLQPAAGASKGLRAQIEKIDQFMHVQRQMLASISETQPGLTTATGLGSDSGGVVNGQNGVHHIQLPHTNSLGMSTPLDEFQLPPDVVGEWPWPFDFTQEVNGHAHATSVPQMMNGFKEEVR